MRARLLRWNVGTSPQPFTSREREITNLILQGHSNRAIAATLGITEQSVKNHLTAIFEKRGVSNRLQLALALGRMLEDLGELVVPLNGGA